MRYEADGLRYTESDLTQIACMECLTEFDTVVDAEIHVTDYPGHAVVVSEVHEIEIVKI